MKKVVKYIAVALLATAVSAPTVEAATTWTVAQAKVIAGIRATNTKQSKSITALTSVNASQAGSIAGQAASIAAINTANGSQSASINTLNTEVSSLSAAPTTASGFGYVSSGFSSTLSALCPFPKHAYGGGMYTSDPNVRLSSSYPATSSSWTVTVVNLDTVGATYNVYAVCS